VLLNSQRNLGTLCLRSPLASPGGFATDRPADRVRIGAVSAIAPDTPSEPTAMTGKPTPRSRRQQSSGQAARAAAGHRQTPAGDALAADGALWLGQGRQQGRPRSSLPPAAARQPRRRA